jgi:hypothetical protein
MNERDEVFYSLPVNNTYSMPPVPEANAYVCRSDGKVHIFPTDGGYLGCDSETMQGDIAPFCG